MPEIIKATFEIVTPMFLGDARSDQLADTIRPPSVKGALRFWWRALKWDRFIRKHQGDKKSALRALWECEAVLFGNASEGEHGSQSPFLIRIEKEDTTLQQMKKGNIHPEFARFDGARYLGFGLMASFGSRRKQEKAGQLYRPCINASQSFVVKLLARSDISSSVLNALKLFGLLGGLGSRTRRGLGSCALSSIKNADGKILWSEPKDETGYIAAINELLPSGLKTHANGHNANIPPFSAFSQKSRIDLLTELASNPVQVLNELGKNMMMYRSWGKDGKVLGEESEKNFPQDHNWKYGKTPSEFHPRRVVFGLPHNYGKKEDGLEIAAEHHDRRASPLLLHVHKLGKMYIGVSVLLPSEFLPMNERIKAGKKNVPPNIEWSVLTEFLDGNGKEESTGNVRFPAKKAVIGTQS